VSLNPTELSDPLEIFKGARWSMELQLWADKEHTKPFDFAGRSVEFALWGTSELTLKEGAGITVTPGKEAVGDEPAEPASVQFVIGAAQTGALTVVRARFLVSLLANDEPEWLLRGWAEIEGP
jgi:hypothetical protein